MATIASSKSKTTLSEVKNTAATIQRSIDWLYFALVSSGRLRPIRVLSGIVS